MKIHSMKYSPLGKCGTKVSRISLGGWVTFGEQVKDQQLVRDIVATAFEAGINFFDIADVYARGEAEGMMGKVLRDYPRRELIISSKVFFPMSDDVNDRGLSRKHILESVNDSLQRIGTDYLDLYFCHRYDNDTPLEETLRAMDDLVHQGKILYWGTSEWTGAQLREAHQMCRQNGWYPPQVEQPRYNLLARKKLEKDVHPATKDLGMGMVTFSPLAWGMLTGKYDEGLPEGTRLQQIEWLRKRVYTEENLDRVRRMKEYADQLNCTRAQLAIAWLLHQEGVSSVITGATKLGQLNENLKSLYIQIPDEILIELDTLFPHNLMQA